MLVTWRSSLAFSVCSSSFTNQTDLHGIFQVKITQNNVTYALVFPYPSNCVTPAETATIMAGTTEI